MKTWHFFWLLPALAQARPISFSDGHCIILFPTGYRSQGPRLAAQLDGRHYSLTRSPLKGLDPAQQLASVRREQVARHASVQLIKLGGRDGLEVRAPHRLARIAVYEQTVYQAEVTFPEDQPVRPVREFVGSLRFLSRLATPYTSQRMARYDAQVKNVPVQKCAEQLLEISSLLTGFKIKNQRFPSDLNSLKRAVTRGYGYRRQGGHYLLYCQAHRHSGLPEHYPRTDDSLHTMLGPGRPYTPGY
ncbi:hypothetical protein JST97_36675 [bacterium]|nr:hypothetical protein [bacterium]